MKTGTVKFYNTEKGFGFIQEEESKKDVFFHKSGLIDRVQDNDKVEFKLEEGVKGFFASEVKRV